MGLTPDELALARERVKQWPIDERRFLTKLTEPEAQLVLEGVAALDLRPVEDEAEPVVLPDPDRNTIGKHQRPGAASSTQINAALLVYPLTGTKRRIVLDMIRMAGEHGATDDEMQLELGMNPSTQRPRRVELVDDGWVEDSGRSRPTRSGVAAVVWVLTEAGRAHWA
jgi:hypothetical protein